MVFQEVILLLHHLKSLILSRRQRAEIVLGLTLVRNVLSLDGYIYYIILIILPVLDREMDKLEGVRYS